MTAGPFYFAWVNSDQTTFDPSTMNVMDEDIFEFKLDHEEGQIPTLDLTIVNPRVGLLSPNRKLWGWLSYEPISGSGIVPLFFGVLVGIPDDLFAELITIKMISKSLTYISDKQAVAEGMKVRPFWDPVFITPTKRDDPDSILEGWSALWHVDRTSMEVTASDILVGEDGTIEFGAANAEYKSVRMKVGQAPINTIEVNGTVRWTQRSTGFVAGPSPNIQSYTGDTLISQWMKPGESLGAGWRVESSFVRDVYKTALTPMVSTHVTQTNNDPGALEGSFDTIDSSTSGPALLNSSSLYGTILLTGQSGLLDPTADPPINRPAVVHVTGMVVPLWTLNLTSSLRYDAHREATELLTFSLNANVQTILSSPTVDQDSEVLNLDGADVSQPLMEIDAWSDFANSPVGYGQIIFPNDPSNPANPGGLSYQVCVVAGIAGSVEPRFSDFPGALTDDGTVVWTSLGETPETNPPGWSPATEQGLGEVIYCTPNVFNDISGQWEPAAQGSFLLCIQAGVTNSFPSEILWLPPITDSDDAINVPVPIFHIIGPLDVAPGAVPVILTGATGPNQQQDGTVIWIDMGPNPPYYEIPIGGTIDECPAQSYFPTDRGLWSVEYLISRARAKLRMRARAVTLSWDCPFDAALGLSCRMNASLADPRLPGGEAAGKVISYSLTMKEGKARGHVDIGCSVGFNSYVTEDLGDPEYAGASGYCLPGYQRMDGALYVVGGSGGTSDVNYTPPLAGFYAPLPGWAGAISGSAAEQAPLIQAAFAVNAQLAWLGYIVSLAGSYGSLDFDGITTLPGLAWDLVNQTLSLTQGTVAYVMASNPVGYAFTAESVEQPPLNNGYQISCSQLELPMGINLGAH